MQSDGLPARQAILVEPNILRLLGYRAYALANVLRSNSIDTQIPFIGMSVLYLWPIVCKMSLVQEENLSWLFFK
jgi:hypothetical protein